MGRSRRCQRNTTTTCTSLRPAGAGSAPGCAARAPRSPDLRPRSVAGAAASRGVAAGGSNLRTTPPSTRAEGPPRVTYCSQSFYTGPPASYRHLHLQQRRASCPRVRVATALQRELALRCRPQARSFQRRGSPSGQPLAGAGQATRPRPTAVGGVVQNCGRLRNSRRRPRRP